MLLSEFLAHTPPEVLMKNFGLDRSALAKLPTGALYIFPGTVPTNTPAQDREEIGGGAVASPDAPSTIGRSDRYRHAAEVHAKLAEGGYVCNREGQVISGLYTLGSTQKGRLYESVAVPELRGQAADLAAHLLASALA